MKYLSLLPLAAVGLALFLSTGAQAVPQCNGRGDACNQYPWKTTACSECLSCLSKGGKYRHVAGNFDRKGLCELKAEARRDRPAAHPGTPGRPSAPSGSAMDQRK